MDIIEILRNRLTALLDERQAAAERCEAILAAVAAEERSDLTAPEADEFNALRSRITQIDTDPTNGLKALEQRINDIEASRAAQADASAQLQALAQCGVPAPAGGARVTAEPATYRAGGEYSFFRDFFTAARQPDAAVRLGRHEAETRASNAGNFTGLVVPQYLVDEFAPLARAGKPLANSLQARPLPAEGMTLNIGRMTTGTITGIQASENATLSNQDADDTLLSAPVATVGGYADISRQAVERGANADQEITADLMEDYAVRLDTQLINGSGSSGQVLGVLGVSGINSVTYTDASPTVSELWPKLMQAVGLVNNTRYLPATVVYMTPLRWAWMLAALDTANRPLINTDAPTNVIGLGKANEYGQVVGTIAGGIPVITDANIPANLGAGTNEDRIIVARASDWRFWQESENPRLVTVDQVGAHTLTLRYVAYGYVAFTAGKYPAATAVVSGTGLVTPTF